MKLSKKHISWGLLAGILMIVVGFIVNFIFAWIFPSFQEIYLDTHIFVDMTTPRSMLFWLYALVLGIGLAWLYDMVKKQLDKKPCKAGLQFAWIFFVINGIPMFLINVSSFNLPVAMIFSWTIMSFLNGWVAGCLFAKKLK